MKFIDINLHHLIGIGDFSHSTLELWEYRFSMLKNAMTHMNKKINVFMEDTNEHIKNIMKDKKLKKHKPYMYNNIFPCGVYDRYMYHTWECKIYIKIINYIKKNKSRINFYGVIPIKYSEKNIASNVLKLYNPNYVNFFWAHNDHISNQYIKNKLGDSYLILLSQSNSGTIRFDSFCINNDCNTRIWYIKYFYINFGEIKKKCVPVKYYYNKYDKKFICFSNSYYITKKNKELNGGYYVEYNLYDRVLSYDFVNAVK